MRIINRVVVVLGMHRSGTSVITRGLQVMGVGLGDRMLPAMEDNNAKGFWEDVDLNALNIEMLSALGSDWHHLAPIERGEVEDLHKKGYFLRAIELLRQKVGNSTTFGFKDPRVAKLFPFWKGVFRHCQFELSYVLAVRHPLSVAKSLAKRDGLDARKSYLLWLGHVITSLSGTMGEVCVIVDYDRFMESPENELHRIAKCLELEIGQAGLQIYKSEFINEGLRHTLYDLNDLLLDDACPQLVREIYTALLDVASDKIRIQDPAIQNKISHWVSEFERLKSPLILADELYTQQAITAQAVVERDTQISILNQSLQERDTQNTALCERLHEVETMLNTLLSSNSWRVTKPFRFIRRSIIRRPYGLVRHIALGTARAVWQWIPLTIQRKQKLADRLYSHLPSLFRRTQASIHCQQDVKEAPVVAEEVKNELRKTAVNVELKPLPSALATPTLPMDTYRKRILLVSHYCPSRAHGGGLRLLDIYSLVKASFPGIILDLYTHKRPEIDWSYSDIERIFDRIHFSPIEKLSPSGLSKLCGVSRRYDVIDLQFHQSAHYLNQWRTMGKKILFTPMESLVRSLITDVRATFRRDTPISPRKIIAGIKSAAEEIVFASKADEVVCVSRTDASLLRFACGSRKIKVLETAISNIEFSCAIDNKTKELKPEHKDNTILYVAYFGSETNLVALKWYLENVHPLIKKAVPGYTIQVVGRGDTSTFLNYQLDSVEYVGEVPSLAPYIDAAKVGIAPALSGSGFRGKINQYAIFGVPSVASSVSAKGLAYEDGIDIYITDEPDVFADRCIRLLQDDKLNKTIGQQARDKAFSMYSWESRLDAIRKIYALV